MTVRVRTCRTKTSVVPMSAKRGTVTTGCRHPVLAVAFDSSVVCILHGVLITMPLILFAISISYICILQFFLPKNFLHFWMCYTVFVDKTKGVAKPFCFYNLVASKFAAPINYIFILGFCTRISMDLLEESCSLAAFFRIKKDTHTDVFF